MTSTGQQTLASNGIAIAYEVRGPEDGQPLLLVNGLGSQMIGYRTELCDKFARRGFRVIRFDNRDVGHSTYFDDRPLPDIRAILKGDLSTAAYTLSDMAADAVGLLDGLGIEAAHIVGMSMGGMLVQRIAIDFPERVLSMTSIMSTTGERSVGRATPEANARLMQPLPADREEALDKLTEDSRVIGSPGFVFDAAKIRAQHVEALDRATHPAGTARQQGAIFADSDRTPALRELRLPTLVIHGADDPLIGVSGGEATAAAVSGAQLKIYPGMGHNLPEDLWDDFVADIAGIAGMPPA
ncbi:pimeloyl-ACP methyl ester carboxylesterase [Antricoccus suffuscus]|uniref:Pimeloyl-ACP methyl ester carboxylesterase n=1 Tax=Antricoccus suffuscus TaxID=1629062 RepID=A0A2T0ZW95_9ACTN|nr:alpha/beta hydrolase [Antricoccus suffuscus]PRZ40527.1 pimeloyl-ACP methyl ester carboxylesterase [Antricoccus suffuscus]